MTFFLQLVVTGFSQGMIYALAALGFVIVLKCSKAFNVAQGQFVMIGGYLGYTFLGLLHLPVWLSMIIAIVLAIVMGLVVERLILRPMVGKPVLAIIMVTMGLATILDAFAVFFWESQYLTYHGLLPTINMQLGGISVPPETLIGIMVSIVAVSILMIFFRYTRIGLVMRATAEDEQVVQIAGINVTKVYAISWAIAWVVGIIGGILLGGQGGVTIQMENVGLKVLAVVLLGGIDSVEGAVVAGIMLGMLENIAAGYLDPMLPAGGLATVFPFIIMIIVLIFRPYGLFGLKRIERI
jgi:branched-chain amino acid transport system permease protein